LVYAERLSSLSDVLKREGRIKKLSRQKKMQLIDSGLERQKDID